jgi:TPR repeat protein
MGISMNNINDWQKLLQAAEQGDANAQLEIAFHYESGVTIGELQVVEANPKLAFSWTKSAYENGNMDALESYAYFLSVGEFCERDLALAIELYEEGIKRGSETAAHNLGTVFRDQHKFEQAFSLYEKAGGDISVGMCYYYGIGVPKDKLKALRFFEDLINGKAELCGYDTNEVHYMIGRMYLEGEVVESSLEKARHHLALASEDGDHRSAQQILWVIGSN